MLLGWGLLAGCSGTRDASELLGTLAEDIPVVDAVLFVGEPFPPVRLGRTLDPGAPFSPEAAALSGAAVLMTGGDDTLRYIELGPGYYDPLSGGIVQPGTVYRLRVDLADGRRVTAVTTTPAALTMERWVLLESDGETVRRDLVTFAEAGDGVYDRNRLVHSDGLLEAWAPVRTIMPPFQVGVESLDLDSDFVIDVSFIDEEDLEDIERHGASPALLAPDGRLRLPWLAVPYGGRYVIRVFAVDLNWYDLIRSLPALSGGGQGFGGNAGDDFEKPIFHIEGGIGLFGSAAVDSVGFYVLPPDSAAGPASGLR